MSVRNYQYSLRNNPEERSSQLQCIFTSYLSVITMEQNTVSYISILQKTPHFKRHPTSKDTPLQKTPHFPPQETDKLFMILQKSCVRKHVFLGAFAKLRRATCVMPVRLSVRMEQLGSHWTDFHEI